MKMNIEMYEHTLIPPLRAMEDELKLLNQVKAAVRDCYEETGEATELEQTYREQLLRFGRSGDALKIAIIDSRHGDWQ